MIYFSSDHHFSHENIIRYCQRPFADAEEMAYELTQRWNNKVGKEDVVYYAGDLTLEGIDVARSILQGLNGHIKMLHNGSHHDKRWLPATLGWEVPYWTASGPVAFLGQIVTLDLADRFTPGIRLPRIVFSHFKLDVWENKHHGSWHLYGHTHMQNPFFEPFHRGWCLNIGVDAWDYAPVSVVEVAEVMIDHGYGESREWVNDEV
jgi:calcineurin-like phosphoesterase family protein